MIMMMIMIMIMTPIRFADIAPTGLMHKTVCDVALDGFELGQDTLVLANHSACHKVESDAVDMYIVHVCRYLDAQDTCN